MTHDEFLTYFRTLDDREIRRRQDLCDQQIARAFKSRNTPALERLRTMEGALTAAMLERC
jgi:hypothetical protein